MKKVVFLLIILLLTVTDEALAKRRKRYDCAGKIARAVARYQKKRYNDVKTILDQAKIHCSGHSSMDTALYYLGKANLKTKHPVQASLEFEVLLQDFPHSPFREEAHFLLGICSYEEALSFERDQSKTRDAIREFVDFIDLYPQSTFADSAKHYLIECQERLVKKEFMNARFYEKIDQYEAAIVYYRIIIDEFPQSSYIPESKLSLARNLIKVSRPKEAADVLEKLLSSDFDGEVKKKAKLLLGKIEKSEGIKPKKEEPDSTSKDESSL
jgi:outer membrane protein assembly factor BamD